MCFLYNIVKVPYTGLHHSVPQQQPQVNMTVSVHFHQHRALGSIWIVANSIAKKSRLQHNINLHLSYELG